jgi:protein-S-isoprenylcysteine O-methyltransferase Ste14
LLKTGPPPPMNTARSLLVGVALILLEVAFTLATSFAALSGAAILLGAPVTLSLPWALRTAGLFVAGAAVAVIADTLRYRDPKTMLLSTSVTLRKWFGRMPIELPAGRTEPFTVVGAYRYTRNPLYLGVVLLAVGAGVLGSSPLLLVWGVALLGWYWFLLIPYEERELSALFGEAYAGYRAHVPKLFPYRRPYRESGGSPGREKETLPGR